MKIVERKVYQQLLLRSLKGEYHYFDQGVQSLDLPRRNELIGELQNSEMCGRFIKVKGDPVTLKSDPVTF